MSDNDINTSKSIDPSMSWEWNGTLSKAAGNATLFALYLSMQQSALADTISIDSPNEVQDSSDITKRLEALNFYRKVPLSAGESDWLQMQKLSQVMASQLAHQASQVQFDEVRLYKEMHPMPLAQTNDPKKISQDIITNCSLATQKRIAATYASTLPEDNTMLGDIIEQSESFLAA
ncbi:VC2046/SO_2500 family protein [Alteromonas sp. 1_MG-2023]|uniref:VC2046/SO_2500 family protein n=1 Tax=Alteromonas sp. 1_MG-2023 TaxID=3062669 RepID=UPI0026E494C1|nr:VC2046/SO_2500 family protein [Alteromonas sp. 1_MG-2023]MDO6565931.1 VC2046/SO_2500 family protein [Alteromonas sp. 1_MG-2023]